MGLKAANAVVSIEKNDSVDHDSVNKQTIAK
jgi:hypothetical protein